MFFFDLGKKITGAAGFSSSLYLQIAGDSLVGNTWLSLAASALLDSKSSGSGSGSGSVRQEQSATI